MRGTLYGLPNKFRVDFSDANTTHITKNSEKADQPPTIIYPAAFFQALGMIDDFVFISELYPFARRKSAQKKYCDHGEDKHCDADRGSITELIDWIALAEAHDV